MYQNYLITGATGFLGRAVLQLLLAHSFRVVALVMDKDPLAYTIPENVTVFCGDLTDKDTLRSFFAAGGDDFCVLHCAGMVSIASRPGEIIYRVNVDGQCAGHAEHSRSEPGIWRWAADLRQLRPCDPGEARTGNDHGTRPIRAGRDPRRLRKK